MCHSNFTTIIGEKEDLRKKNSRLTEIERKLIQKMLNKRMKQSDIARELNRDRSVISREVRRNSDLIYRDSGSCYLKYSSARAQGKYQCKRKKAGRISSVKKDKRLKTFIDDKIRIQKWSPEEVAGYIKANNIEFVIKPSFQTIYYWIYTNQLETKTMDLTHRLKLKAKKDVIVREQAPSRKHKSIHLRPEIIDKNEEFGHWEMDCVEGSKSEKEILLTLLERKTKQYIAIKMKDGKTESVVKTIDHLEKTYKEYFKHIFKTITTDNGVNFLNYNKIEKSCIYEGNRFEMYYTDPYSAWQKGMNENCNGILRRFIPKGSKIGQISEYDLETILYKLNNKPRGILGFKQPRVLFQNEINDIIKAG